MLNLYPRSNSLCAIASSLLLIFPLLASAQYSKGWGENVFDSRESIRLKSDETFRKRLQLKAGETSSLLLELKSKRSFRSLIKNIAPLAAGVAAEQVFHRSQSFEGISPPERTGKPYISLGATLSAGTLRSPRGRKEVYLDLTYLDLHGNVVTTRSHRIGNKLVALPINSPQDGWLDVAITAPKGYTVQIKQISKKLGKIPSFSSDAVAPGTLNREPDDDKKPEDEGGASTQKVPEEGPPPVTLPEVIVHGNYNYGYTGFSWSTFLQQFQNGSAPGGGGEGYTASQPVSSGNNSYNSGVSNPPNRSVSYSNAYRFPSLCNGMTDMWNISFSNNDANTVEMAGYELSDGTFLMLPWQGNTSEKSTFTIGGTGFTDYTGVFSYRVQVVNGHLSVIRQNMITYAQTVTQITSYVHTHPFSDGSHDVMNPTPVIGNPGDSDYQQFGDYQLSYLYGIPGKIITPNHVIDFHYDPTDPNNPRKKDQTVTKAQRCPTSRPD